MGKRFRLLNEPRFTLSLMGFLLIEKTTAYSMSETGSTPVWAIAKRTSA